MYGQVANYENKFYINGQELLGIESLDVSYSHSSNVNNLLGFFDTTFSTAIGQTTISGPVSQKASITRNIIYTETFFAYVAVNESFSGSLNYNNNNYGFRSGYMDDCSISCAVGSVPKITTNISIYDELVTGSKNASGSLSTPTIYIPNQGSISLTCDQSTTNRVVGFDVSLKANRQPIYSIGSKLPTEVVSRFVQYSASVQIDVDDAFLSSSLSFLSGIQNKTVSFSIRGRTGNLLQQITIPNASLVGESLSSSADGGVKLTLNYIGHS